MPKPTYEQLEEQIKALQQENITLKQANEKLLDSEQSGEHIYQALFEHAGFSITLINPAKRKLVMFNRTEHETLGYTREELEQLPHPGIAVQTVENRETIRRLVDEKGAHYFETKHRAKDGSIKHRLVSSVKLSINNEMHHLNIASDITQLKQTEQALKETRDELEERVTQKTIQLTESNIALKVLLQKKDEEVKNIEGRLLENTKQRVIPHIEKLKKTNLNEQQLTHLIELEINLNEILSPFLKRLSNQYRDLTPTEIQIAAYIRDGKTSKNIADLLSVSMNTIEVHRDNLRKKLGLKHKKINLQSYLRTLEA